MEHISPNPSFYLTRLSLDFLTSPATDLNPYPVLQSIFEFGSLPELQDLFRQFTESAMTEDYSWKEGCPGNLLHFSQLLERLMEASWLLYQRHEQVVLRQEQPSQTLPGGIRSFFRYQPLPHWKQDLQLFTEAALSNFAITEVTEAGKVIPFCRHAEQLMVAAYHVMRQQRIMMSRNQVII